MNRERIAELFAHAAALPQSELGAWLDANCGDDAALRAELLQRVRAVAQSPGVTQAPPEPAPEAAEPEQPAGRPQQFGPYRVLRSIGAGGMGEVWLAERSDGEFEQRVAIKQVAYPTPGLLQRFRQERQILARLEHPLIARLIDGGVAADGTPYLIMEYIDGVAITEYVSARAFDAPARLRLFLRVCEAVQYAHQNLIVHRDLKPSNIFVTAEGVPKLLDFGIAKVLQTSDAQAASRTQTRMMTPDYAAPEQFSGGSITTATDVYALGVVLYELLAGARPHRPTLIGASHTDAIVITEPPPPSAAVDRGSGDALARRRALRGDLDRIVLTALANEPARRYPSAEALASDIHRFLEGRPIAARGDSAMYRFRKFARRHAYMLAVLTFAFAVCVAATVVSVRQAHVARLQADRAEAVRQFLVGVFEQADPNANKQQSLSAHQLLERGERQLADTGNDQPAIHADLTGLIGGLYWDLGDYARAEPLLRQALTTSADPDVPDEIKARALRELARMELGKHAYDAATAHARQALEYAAHAGLVGTKEVSDLHHILLDAITGQGEAKTAEPLLREALVRDRSEYGERSDAVVEDLTMLGRALDELSRYTESESTFRQAIASARGLHGEEHSSVSAALGQLGLMLGHKGDYAGSELALRAALAIDQKVYGPEHQQTLSDRSNLVSLLEDQARYAEALTLRMQLVQAQGKLNDALPEELAYAHNYICNDLRYLGRLAEAEAQCRESLALWTKVHGSASRWDSADALKNLALTLQLAGRYAEAESAFRDTIAIEREHEPPTSHWLNRDRGYLGNLLRQEHRYAEAVQELRASIAALESPGSEPDTILAIAQAELSEALLDSGEIAPADAVATQALALVRKTEPPGTLRLGIPLYALARAKLALNQPAAALPLLREALAVRSPPHPADDLRVIEVKVGLVQALAALQQTAEAEKLRAEIEAPVRASPSPYAADLRARLR